MIDDTVTEEEQQELGEVVEAVFKDLEELRRKLAFALRCDELDLNLEVRWDVTDVNSCAEDGFPTYCGTTLMHGKLVVPHHELSVDSRKLLPPRKSDNERRA